MKNLFLVFAFIAFGIFAEKDDMQDLVNKINLILPDGIKVQDISFSDERNLYVINVGDIQPIYMLPDGEHVILGDIFNISEGEAQSTTEKDKDIFRKNKLNLQFHKGFLFLILNFFLLNYKFHRNGLLKH